MTKRRRGNDRSGVRTHSGKSNRPKKWGPKKGSEQKQARTRRSNKKK